MAQTELRTNSLIGIAWCADVAAAARLMTKKEIGALGIYSTDGDDLMGIVTERDITRAVARGIDPATTTVRDVMTDTPLWFEGPVTREEAAQLMRAGHVRHLIVKENGCDRIVSLRDL